ncbi:MAG: GGDEF domain-containing protein, partial [Firmicutes bacterium]|nr:GGDEF domain-containing protein [Bacillota bacterium]
IEILLIERAVQFVLGIEAGNGRFGEGLFSAVPRTAGRGAHQKKDQGKPQDEAMCKIQDDRNKDKREKIPGDFAVLGNGSGEFPSISALCAVLPGNYTAVLVPADWPDLPGTIKQLRREPIVSALPIVVVGPCDAKECYAAGADECVDVLDDGTIERVRVKAARMKELWAQAERDPLTGLYNRRFLEKYLAEKERQFKEKGVPFSVALLDLDHFKNINDKYGHQAGDTVLKEFASFLCLGVRKTDIISRYGGEEFMVVFPGTRNAWGIVERLRRGWAGREIALPGREAVKSTFSAGLATIGKDAANCSDLIKAADKALYRAKERGRNRVEMDVKKLYVAGMALKLRLPKEIKTTKKPSEADFALVDAFSYRNVPDGVPLVVVKSGTVADFPVLTTRPDAVVLSPEEAVRMIADLFIGIRSNEPVSLPIRLAAGENKGVIYVVCPARPESAGEVAAEMARKTPGSALVCASANSTGALALGIPPEDLICSDWRLPGSSAPVMFNGVTVWPVDPLKYLDVRSSVDELVNQISRKFPLVVVDCSGNLELCARVPKHYKVVVVDHSSSKIVELWLKNYGGENVEIVA